VVLLRLDITREMVFCPGGIPKIRDIDGNPFVNLQSARTRSLVPETLAGVRVNGHDGLDNGTSDVAAVEADDGINVDEGPVFELDTVTPECDGDIWLSNDGPSSFEGRGFAF